MAITAIRLRELHEKPVDGIFDYAHMNAIHHHVFQNVYEWTREERVGPAGFVIKDGHAYYPAGPVLAAAEAEYRKLTDKETSPGPGARCIH